MMIFKSHFRISFAENDYIYSCDVCLVSHILVGKKTVLGQFIYGSNFGTPYMNSLLVLQYLKSNETISKILDALMTFLWCFAVP